MNLECCVKKIPLDNVNRTSYTFLAEVSTTEKKILTEEPMQYQRARDLSKHWLETTV